MKILHRLPLFLQQIGLSLALAIVASICILMVFFNTSMPQNSDEIPLISANTVSLFLLMLFGAGVICAALFSLRKSNPKHVFLAASVTYLIVSFVLLLSYSDHLRGDAAAVYESAQAFSSGDLTPFQKAGYIHQFPHQIGLMYYYLLGTSIFGNVRWIYYANIAWGLISNYAIWSITRNYKHSTKTAEIASILFPLLFLPHTFFNLYGYNHSPSLALCLLGAHFLQRYFQEENLKNLPAIFLFFSGSVLIRQNFKIIILAALIVSFIFLIHSVKASRFILLSILLASFSVPTLVQKGTEGHLGFEIGEGIPAVTWVAFGLQDSRHDEIRFHDIYRGRLPGWFNRYSGHLWVSTGYDSEETKRIATEDLKHFAHLRFSAPDHGAKFFVTKVASSWIEPTYQSIFFGALPAEDFFSNGFLRKLYSAGKTHESLTATLRSLAFAIFALTVIGLGHVLARKKLDFSAHSVLAVAVLGAFLFHLLWEIKGAYVYPYVYMLIPFSSLGLSTLSQIVTNVKTTGLIEVKRTSLQMRLRAE